MDSNLASVVAVLVFVVSTSLDSVAIVLYVAVYYG